MPEGPHERITHNTPYRAGKGFLYEGGLRVPLIVRWPGHVPANRIVAGPVLNTDWLPTLLDLAGLPIPQDLDGLSLRDCLTGGADTPARSFYWHFPHYTNQGSRPAGAIRDGDWKLIEHYEDQRAELFNLATDVQETNDLATREPERTRSLRATGRLAPGSRRASQQPEPRLQPGSPPSAVRRPGRVALSPRSGRRGHACAIPQRGAGKWTPSPAVPDPRNPRNLPKDTCLSQRCHAAARKPRCLLTSAIPPIRIIKMGSLHR